MVIIACSDWKVEERKEGKKERTNVAGVQTSITKRRELACETILPHLIGICLRFIESGLENLETSLH